ncbi:hypothetical protein BO71DRAFT_403678 [Aspergillus ellipticus CBS 707.79]|uniref:Uncharacterized protein n=1 Tax=Aspergillus ellipticus CBS 707.79 TaxID=1448320 RepID=A0A319DKS9_9EURO|nr:hypothetical protein BO71DRAFT_403678 [Aspergillus ellipticus CBS 707.79]
MIVIPPYPSLAQTQTQTQTQTQAQAQAQAQAHLPNPAIRHPPFESSQVKSSKSSKSSHLTSTQVASDRSGLSCLPASFPSSLYNSSFGRFRSSSFLLTPSLPLFSLTHVQGYVRYGSTRFTYGVVDRLIDLSADLSAT